MHIVHVATGFIGGPIVIVRQLLEMQRGAGHRVTLIYGKTHNGYPAGIDQLPSGLELIGWDAGRQISLKEDAAAYRALVEHLRVLKPDVVHIHNSKAGALARLACLQLGIRNLYSPHGPAYLQHDAGLLKRTVYFVIEWLLALLGDQLVASSEGELRAMRTMPARKHLVHNGLDIALIERKALAAPARPKGDRLRIALSSRIWAQKNPEQVARLAAQSPADWEWLWIGDGPAADRAVVDATGRVDILGWQPSETVLATIKSADIYLQASRWEGMSFALIEAMCLGCPPVVSNVPGNQDVVENEVSGLVCMSDAEFMAALQRLANDPALRQRLGAGAAARVRASFSLDQIAARWSQVYRSMAPKGASFRDFVAVSST